MKNSGIPLSKLSRRIQDQVAAALYPETVASPAASRPPALEVPGVGTLSTPPAVVGLKRALSSPYPLTLWLDYHIPSLNTVLGKTPWAVVKMKKKSAAAVHAALAVMGKYPQNPKGRMHVIITCYVCQPRDTDNPVPKFMIDEFRACGILRDDDPGSMFHTMNPEVRVSKRKLEGTKVVICQALP